MKYPALCPWVELTEIPEGFHLTDTHQNRTFRIKAEYESLIRGLDGRTSPVRLAPHLPEEERNDILSKLQENKLTRRKAYFEKGFLSLYFHLPLPRCGRLGRLRAVFFNNMLFKMWLPTLILGIWQTMAAPPVLLDDGIWLGSIGGAVLGLLLHELAHACACMAYGGQVTSCGLLLFCLLPGAFVELDPVGIKSPLQKAQIFAAGVEMNLYLTGSFLLLSGLHPALGTPCLSAAFSNGILALINLTLTFGLDGIRILSALLDVEDLCVLAMDVLFDRDNRRKLRRKGFTGGAALSFCSVALGMILILPLVVLVNISEVILWFL